MSDPRMQEIAERAQAAARRAEFAELARRGRRRRAGGILAAGAATAVVVAGTTLGVRGAYDDSSAPIHPVTPTPSTSTTSRGSTPPTAPDCRTTYDCQLIALLQEIGVKHPLGDHGYRGSLMGGPYRGRYLQVATYETQLHFSPGRRVGSLVVAGLRVDIYSDVRGERAQFIFDGLRYQVTSKPLVGRGSSTRDDSIVAARALIGALRSGDAALPAEQIVNDPNATLTDIAVAADDSDVRAAVWTVCSNEACSRQESAVAVTSDAFRHAGYVLVGPSPLTWVGGSTFIIRPLGSELSRVDATGAFYPLRIGGDAAPLSTTETLLFDPQDASNAYGTDA